MHKIHTLPNGLTVLMVPNPASQAVVVDAFVKVGSRHEDERINGISHFLEHLNFKGTKKYPQAKVLSEAVDSVGGVMNANTGKEHTQYYVLVAAKHIKLAFDVTTELFLNPLFKPKEIEREKGVIVEEINMYLDSPQRHVLDMVEEGLWANHALGRNIAGTPAHVRAITKKDITDYRKSFYSPRNTIVAVAGNFDEAEVLKLVKKLWSGFSGPDSVPTAEGADMADINPLVLQEKATSQAHFAIGFRGLDREDERNYAVSVLSAVLSGGMSSRLFTEVRERRGLAYYVGAYAENYNDTGAFVVRAGVELAKISDALGVIVKELAKLKKNSITALELKKAKEYWKGRVALSLEDTESKMGWYLEQVAFSKKVEEPKAWMRKIDKVTVKDVKEAAKVILDNTQATLAVVGPYDQKKADGLRKMIDKL